MAEREEERPRLDELIAYLRAIREEQQVLVQELRLLQHEIRTLREELRPRALRPEAFAPAPVPVPTTAPPAPRLPQRTWRESVSRVLATLPKPLTETPRSLLERSWLLALLVGLLVAGASELNLLQPVEVLAEYPKEWVRADRSRREVVSQIAVVAIDDESVAKLGAWGKSWRAYHGQLLKNLADDGAKAVGFDVYFNTPSEEHDPVFVEGIHYARAKGTGVVVGMEYDVRRNRLSYPASPVREAVTSFASVYLAKDRVTNLVRYVSMFQPDGAAEEPATRLVPAFSLAVALAGGKREEEFPRYRQGIVPIDFAGPSGNFQTVPYSDAHEKRFPPGTFKGKYVVVGMFVVASKDFFDTPVESQMPGVLIHTNALYTLLRGVRQPLEIPWSVLVIVATAAVAGVICARFRKTPRAFLVVLLIAGYWALANALGTMRNPLNLEVIPATAAAGLVWAGVAMREKIVTMRELRRTLGLPEDALRRLEQDRAFQQGTLGKRVTVLASDVKNYSVFSRSHPPAYVREIMTEYQQMVERIIYRHGGYVNKFIGDAVLAIFGYPMHEESTALRGVLAAKEIQDGLRALTEKWKREKKEGIAEIRIGVNTGVVSISYLGSSKKQLDVMGDNVDLAARLESAAGEFDCRALLGPATHEEVKQRIRSRSVPVKLKNRPDVTEAFTLDGLLDEPVSTTGAA
jgi:adenylate cyclase